MKVVINQDLCIGCGMCVGICESVFALNDNGQASVVADPTAAEESAVQDAAASCPVSAISVE